MIEPSCQLSSVVWIFVLQQRGLKLVPIRCMTNLGYLSICCCLMLFMIHC